MLLCRGLSGHTDSRLPPVRSTSSSSSMHGHPILPKLHTHASSRSIPCSRPSRPLSSLPLSCCSALTSGSITSSLHSAQHLYSRPINTSHRPGLLQQVQTQARRRSTSHQTPNAAIPEEAIQRLGIADTPYRDLLKRLKERRLPACGKGVELRKCLAKALPEDEQRVQVQQVQLQTTPVQTADQGREGTGQQAVEGDLSPLQAAERDYVELEEEYRTLRAAATTIQQRRELTMEYQPLLKEAHKRLEDERQAAKAPGLHMSARALLCQALPGISCLSTHNRTQRYKLYPGGKLVMRLWHSFGLEVRAVLESYAQHLLQLQLCSNVYLSEADFRYVCHEDGYREVFTNASVKLALDCVALPAGMQKPISLLGYSMPMSQDVADCAVVAPPPLDSQAAHPPFLIVESKRDTALVIEAVDAAVLEEVARESKSHASNRSHASNAQAVGQCRPLLQPLSYLWQSGSGMAALSSGNRTIFVKRIGQDEYLISPLVVQGRTRRDSPQGSTHTEPDVTAREATFAVLQMSINSRSPFKPGKMEANEPKSAAHQQNKTGRGGTSGRAGTSSPPTDPKGPAFDGPSSHTRSRGPQGPSKKHKPTNGECVLKISGKLQQGAGSALLLGSMDDMPVVFKVVDANMPELIPDLEHEAAIYGRLQHLQGTYIPVLREVGFHFHNSMFTVIIDFIGDAESLHDFVATGKPLPQSLAKEAEKGLAAIHRAGVLHGDLHASNILLKPPSVYFIDFEGSRLSPTASEKQAEMQQLRNILGAPRSSDASDRDVLSGNIHSPY